MGGVSVFPVELYGSGPDEADIRRVAGERNLTMNFHGAIDHAKLTDYKASQPLIKHLWEPQANERCNSGPPVLHPSDPSLSLLPVFRGSCSSTRA